MPYDPIQLIMVFILFALVSAGLIGYPMYRRQKAYKEKRKDLEQRFTRLWRAHRDLVMHYDWALSREDPPFDI
jgi:hypothetical protein